MKGRIIAAITGLGLLLAGAPGMAQDRVFASSFADGRVYEIDFGTSSATLLLWNLYYPEDMVCKEATEEVFVCESNADRVLSLDLVGMTTTTIIPTAGRVAGPEGPSISPAGDFYVNTRERFGTADGIWMVPGGDPVNPAVRVVPPFTTFGEGTAFGTAGSSAGGLLAVDRANGRVMLSNPPGNPLVELISGLAQPFGIAVNSLGEIYVVENPLWLNGWISHWTADGAPLGDLPTALLSPAFLEVDSFDNIVVADANSVLLLDPTGLVIGQVPLPNATGVAICREPPPLPCPMSQGFWKNHPGAWPVDTLVMGAETYTKVEALRLLRRRVRGDASLILAKQLIAAKLNIESGSDPVPVAAEIAAADALLAGFAGKMPYGTHPSTPEGHDMTSIGEVLDLYNNGIFTPNCAERKVMLTRGGGGCSAAVGAPMSASDIAGASLPFLVVALWLGALRIRRPRRPAAAA